MSTQAQEIARPAESTSWKSRALVGLLVVQIIVGFEFFWTVLVKIVRGGFVSGLAADLQNRVQAAPGWYRSLADSVIIPNASLFGYLIIIGELFVGITLIATAIVWLVRWDSLSMTARRTLVGLIVLAAAAALAMNHQLPHRQRGHEPVAAAHRGLRRRRRHQHGVHAHRCDHRRGDRRGPAVVARWSPGERRPPRDGSLSSVDTFLAVSAMRMR